MKKLPAYLLALIASSSAFAAESPDALLDPAVIARSLCSGVRMGAHDAYAPQHFAMAKLAFWKKDKDPILYTDLGALSYKVTTDEPMAQSFFDQGLRLAYAFNHAEAQRAFHKAQRLDGDCAMCYWGEALVLGPNINAPMFPEAVPIAYGAIQKAQGLAAKATPKEQALIAALAKRYSNDPGADRKALDAAYADAMAQVSHQYPDDLDIAVLSAEAIMDTQPWDYWEKGGVKSKGRAGEALASLERVLKAKPDHPGAIHYYIHLVEASTTPARAAPYAAKLAALMPGQGHIVHMPSHVWYRLGQYKDALAANKQAVLIDEAYFKDATPGPVYRAGYYPHNIHFVAVTSYIQGDAKTALEFADKLDAALPDAMVSAAAFVHPVKAAPYFIKAEMGDPASFLASAGPDPKLSYVAGMWHYARGLAQMRLGHLKEAHEEADHVSAGIKTGDFKQMNAGGIPAQDLLQIAADTLNGRIARVAGDKKEAIRLLKRAAEAQDKIPYMEPAYWYYPVRQSLGAAYLDAGKPDLAIREFRGALLIAPNNAYALYGLARAYEADKDKKAAKATDKLFAAAWVGETKPAMKDL
jgi:tetratricopeptide (TPR) repeat protein